jgi:hypothetical protein
MKMPTETKTQPGLSARRTAGAHPRWRVGDLLLLALVSAFAVLTAIYPMAAAFYRFEADYSEGWHAYNTLTVARHLPLYGVKYGWTNVNYPPLFYFVTAHLAWLTPDYLLMGRGLALISFAACIAFVAMIVWKLTGAIAPALFGGSFCVALFCTQATMRIGNNEPNMLACAFCLGGLLLYLTKRDALSFGWIASIVLLFVIGGNFKHNLIEFPLAVFVDLCLLSRRRAAYYFLTAIPLVALSIYLILVYGGPFFLAAVLVKRGIDLSIIDFPMAVILPITVAFFWAIAKCRTGIRRPLLALLLVGLVVDFGFSIGIGVGVNIFFGTFFAISILMGLLLDETWKATPAWFASMPRLWRWGVPVFLCSSLALSFFLSGQFHLASRQAELREKQTRFAAEVAFLKAHPGPAICESLLRCFDAGKPDAYDPSTATILVRAHHLNTDGMVANIDAHLYSSIQLDERLELIQRPSQRFPSELLDAIERDYALALDDDGCAIYVPRR